MRLRIVAALLIALSGPALAQEPPKPAAEPKPPAKPEAEKPTVLQVEKSTKPPECVIKPVMTDDELRACGASLRDNRTK